MLTYVLFLENLYAWLFSNLQGKDLIIGGISCSLNLRVQPSFYHLDIRVFKNALVKSQTKEKGILKFDREYVSFVIER